MAMPWRAEDMGREGDGKLSRTLIRMVNSKVALCVDGCSLTPSGAADYVAEISRREMRVLVSEHVGIDVAEGSVRLVPVGSWPP